MYCTCVGNGYKAIKILAVSWLSTRLIHIFTETTILYRRRNLGGRLGTTTKSVRIQSYSFSNIVLDGWEVSMFIPLKKALFCSLEVHILKKFAAVLRAAILFHVFTVALRAVQSGLYTASYAYAITYSGTASGFEVES